MARTKIQPAEQQTEVSSEPAGYVIYSNLMMRSILAEEPINQGHANLVINAAKKYNRHWPEVSLELAREIARRMNGHA